MKHAYPAIFYPDEDKIGVEVPDLPGLYTFGDDIPDALYMAKDAMEMWLWSAENKNEQIPVASSMADIAKLCEHPGGFVSMVMADTGEYRRQHSCDCTSPAGVASTIVYQ